MNTQAHARKKAIKPARKPVLWRVYGFTDRFCGNGFPGCDKPLPYAQAEQALKDLPKHGFHFRNDKGLYGWMEKAT